MPKEASPIGGTVVKLDEIRGRKQKRPLLSQHDEAALYSEELTDEFSRLLDLETKGGGKNERIRKADCKKS